MAENESEDVFCELIDPVTDHYLSDWGVIIPGADVTPERIEQAMVDSRGPGHSRIVSEVQHLHFHRRIKNCSRLSGVGCEMEGDWHSHWEGVQHNPNAEDCCYTVALPVYDEASR